MICPYCRSDIPDRCRVCPECGERLEQAPQDRGFDRDRFIRRLIGLGILLILALLVLLGVLYVRQSSLPAPPPVVAPAPTIEITPPQATAVPVLTPVPTPVPTSPPTMVPAAPTMAPTMAPIPPAQMQPVRSVHSVSDAALLMGWMLDTNTLRVELDSLSVSKDQLRQASEYHPQVIRWEYRPGDVEAFLSITPKTGAKVLAAMMNNDVGALSAEEQGYAAEAQRIVGQLLTPGMSDYEKELAIHDYIIHHCDYEINESLHTEDAVGFFKYGRVQCSGYSDMFTLLGTLCGLEIRSVEGDVVGETGGHEWNLIRLDGIWYAVDVTWDDPVGGGAETHTYFNVPHGFFDSSRTFNRDTLPEGVHASALDSNYYYSRMGVMAATYGEAQALLTRQLSAGSSAMLCYTGGALDIEGLVTSIMESFGGSWHCSWGENTDLPGTGIYEITIK